MAQRGARIVMLSSAVHKSNPIRLDDLQRQQRPHVDGAAYTESKSADGLVLEDCAEALIAGPGTHQCRIERLQSSASSVSDGRLLSSDNRSSISLNRQGTRQPIDLLFAAGSAELCAQARCELFAEELEKPSLVGPRGVKN
jgi:hypothetical protein